MRAQACWKGSQVCWEGSLGLLDRQSVLLNGQPGLLERQSGGWKGSQAFRKAGEKLVRCRTWEREPNKREKKGDGKRRDRTFPDISRLTALHW